MFINALYLSNDSMYAEYKGYELNPDQAKVLKKPTDVTRRLVAKAMWAVTTLLCNHSWTKSARMM